MGEDASSIEQEIRDRRERLDYTLDALEAKAAYAMDWRHQFRENPKVGLAVAFGVGVMAAGMLPGGSQDEGYPRKNGRTSAAVTSLQTAILGILANEARHYLQRQFGSPRSNGRTD